MPLADLVVKKIMDLQVELLEKQGRKKNMTEISSHDKYDMCLTCKSRVLGEDETAWLPYGKFRYNQMLLHVEYLRHLKCHHYSDSDMEIFLKSLEETKFFEYKNDGTAMWAFEYEPATDI